MAKILVVEDYEPLSQMMSDWLSHESYTVEIVASGAEALHRLKVYKYDVIILDINLPGTNGIEVCRQYRQRGGTAPVLFLTGKGSVEDKEIGLDSGGDDYLVKPIDLKELSARIRAHLRRESASISNLLQCGTLSFDLRSRDVLREGEKLHLTPTETMLLEFFMRHPNQPFTAEALLERVWASDATTSIDTVRSYIRNLRNKIDTEGKPSLISTVHGSGYRFGVE